MLSKNISLTWKKENVQALNLQCYSPKRNACIERTQERLEALFFSLFSFFLKVMCPFCNWLERILKDLIWERIYLKEK